MCPDDAATVSYWLAASATWRQSQPAAILQQLQQQKFGARSSSSPSSPASLFCAHFCRIISCIFFRTTCRLAENASEILSIATCWQCERSALILSTSYQGHRRWMTFILFLFFFGVKSYLQFERSAETDRPAR